MHKLSILILFISGSLLANAQEGNPVTWQFTSKKISANTYEIHCKATVDEPWHIYSQNSESGITLPTKIVFKPNPLVTLSKSPIQEIGELIQEEQKVTGGTLRYYNNEVDFVKVVTLKTHVKTNLTGTVSYMVCTNEKCMPPAEKKFSIILK